jgi:DNA-binding response OmpR family regulator
MRSSSPYRVVIVDDHRDCGEAFECLFEFWGCTTVMAATADSALAEMAERLPDALMADLGLPRLADGLALIRAARRLPGGESILILAVTGYGRDIDRRAAMDAGCDFFFVKPPDLDLVFEALRTIESRRESRLHGDRR